MYLNNSYSKSFFHNSLSLIHLPVLEKLIRGSKKSFPLSETAIVYIHHPLKTSINVVDSMRRLGAHPKNIFALGKKYSECEEVVQKLKDYGIHYQACSKQLGLGQYKYSFMRDINLLWEKLSNNLEKDIQRILILDHGGYATSLIPTQLLERYKVIAVEKTTAGLIKFSDQGLPPFPLISVADCAAKKILESPLIAEAIANKLLSLIPKNTEKTQCGIIGFGAIGNAISTKLLSMNYQVMVYDPCFKHSKTKEGIVFTDELDKLIEFSNYIFGCTGQESLPSIVPFTQAKNHKTLISCSSEDKEFLLLLKAIQRKTNRLVQDPFAEIRFINDKGATIRILKGGFPVNFDNSGESVPSKDIQLTRALVLGAIMQAVELFDKEHILNTAGIYALDPQIQQFIVNEWQKDYSPIKPKAEIKNFQNLKWIIENSGGLYEACSIRKNDVPTLGSAHIKMKFM